MIEIIFPGQYEERAEALDEMFRLRHRIFCERMNWDVRSVNGREHDDFDNHRPVYLLGRDPSGVLVSTWRLLPTTGPYMIRNVFPDLMDGRTMPNDPGVWETSRFAVETEDDSTDSLAAVSEATRELFCGLVEFGIAYGILEVITLYDVRIGRLLPRIGCKPKWRTAGRRFQGTITFIGGFAIDDQVLAGLRAKGSIEGSVLASQANLLPQQAA